MEQTILITGRYTARLIQQAKLLTQSNYAVRLLLNTDKSTVMEDQLEGIAFKTVEGNSPVSLRAALLEESKKKDISYFIVWYEPQYDQSAFHGLNALQLNRLIDQSVNLYSHIVKELLRLALSDKERQILFIENRIHDTILTPADAIASGAFRSLVSSVFAYYKNESIVLTGMSVHGLEDNQVLEKIREFLDEGLKKHQGKWHTFPGSQGLFSKARLFRSHN